MGADERLNGAGDSQKEDRRRNLRVPLIVERMRIDEDRHIFFGYAKSISRGGMFIAATSPKEVGSRFEVSIPLPAPIARTVTCTCEVVWARKWSKHQAEEPGMGLRFIDLPQEISADIDQWIEEALREERLRGAGR